MTTSNIASINQKLQYYGMARGLSNSIIGTQWHDFQPRLGFAWDPKGDGKSSIRGGAGIFYNHNTLSDVTLEGGVTPYQLASEVFNGLADSRFGGDGLPDLRSQQRGCSQLAHPYDRQ